jgi:hypothetical protein
MSEKRQKMCSKPSEKQRLTVCNTIYADFYVRKYAISTPKTKYLLRSENKLPDKTYIISFKHLSITQNIHASTALAASKKEKRSF